MTDYLTQAKQVVKTFSYNTPGRGSITSHSDMFHYAIDNGVVFLILSSASFPRTKAFGYLEELKNEFMGLYESQLPTVTRPYPFIDFDKKILRIQRSYTDSRSSSNVNQLNVALQDVQKIMVQNIDVVINRGESLANLDSRASNLTSMSKKYQKDAHYLSLQSLYAKYAIVCLVLLVVFGFFYFRFMW